jgi:hypothetical protein
MFKENTKLPLSELLAKYPIKGLMNAKCNYRLTGNNGRLKRRRAIGKPNVNSTESSTPSSPRTPRKRTPRSKRARKPKADSEDLTTEELMARYERYEQMMANQRAAQDIVKTEPKSESNDEESKCGLWACEVK